MLYSVAFLGCSSEDKTSSPEETPENLIGSWKFVGIYNYFDIDQTDNPHIEYYDNGNVLTFSSVNTFEDNVEINNNGNFTITADSVLTRFYNLTAISNPYNVAVKIVTLNDSILDFTCTNEDNIGTCPCEAYRYVKVN